MWWSRFSTGQSQSLVSWQELRPRSSPNLPLGSAPWRWTEQVNGELACKLRLTHDANNGHSRLLLGRPIVRLRRRKPRRGGATCRIEIMRLPQKWRASRIELRGSASIWSTGRTESYRLIRLTMKTGATTSCWCRSLTRAFSSSAQTCERIRFHVRSEALDMGHSAPGI